MKNILRVLKELWCEIHTGHYGTLDECGKWFTCDRCGKGVEL